MCDMPDSQTSHIDEMLRDIETRPHDPAQTIGTIACAVDMCDPSTPGRALTAWQRMVAAGQRMGDEFPEHVLDGDFFLVTRSYVLPALFDKLTRRGLGECRRLVARLRAHDALAERPAWRARVLYWFSVVLRFEHERACDDVAAQALEELRGAGPLQVLDRAIQAALLARLGMYAEARERFDDLHATCPYAVTGFVSDIAMATWLDVGSVDDALVWSDRSLEAVLADPKMQSHWLEMAIMSWTETAHDLGVEPAPDLADRAMAEFERLRDIERASSFPDALD
jgi:hypothetical protein